MSAPQILEQIKTAELVAPRMAKLKASSEALEAHFVKDLLKEMQKTVPKASEGDDFGTDTYQEMFNDSVSQSLSKKAGLGLSQMIFKSLEPRAIHEEIARQISITRGKASASSSGENE